MAQLACLKSFFLYGVDIEAEEAPGGELMNNPRIQEETNAKEMDCRRQQETMQLRNEQRS